MSTGGSSSTPSSSVPSPASFAASLPVGTLTSSLLIYLAYKAGLDRRTGETAEHLISFHCAIVSCNGHSLNQQSKQKRPAPFWPQGRVSSATATAISNIRTLEPQAQKQITPAPRTGNGMTEHRSVFHPAITGEMPPWLRHARTMSTWSLPFARAPERPKPYKADCVRSHDCY
jgi:hypothetical protein